MVKVKELFRDNMIKQSLKVKCYKAIANITDILESTLGIYLEICRPKVLETNPQTGAPYKLSQHASD